jgi:alanine transaminase
MLSKHILIGRSQFNLTKAALANSRIITHVQKNSLSDDVKFLNINNLSPAVKNVQYAVRGKVVIRAGELEKEIRETKGLIEQQILPFDKVIRANIGDCHATGQKPITWIRQVMALCCYPELMNSDMFPLDAKDKAKKFLKDCGGESVGSYTDSAGVRIVREAIAEFITKRDDGVPCSADDIYLTTGASGGIKIIMEMLLNSAGEKPAGFMIPIPQYPLYSATISEYSAEQIGYYLNEENYWSLDVDELERSYQASLERCEPKAICIINPGNPTGQVLSLENIQAIIKWAHTKKLFILADEVYQDNVYADGMKFHSFKKVAYDLGVPYSKMEIASFYSTSKGYMGECGARGGFYEIANMDPDVKLELNKLSSAQLCSNVLGQACMYAVVSRPEPEDESYELFMKEKNGVLDGLKEKAIIVTDILNKIEGVTCNPVQGAMYAFPNIKIPEKAIEHAQTLNIAPDMFYCLELIDSTGICVVPGSGFHQRPGTYHFRTTILPPIDQITSLLAKFEKFHLSFVKKWST